MKANKSAAAVKWGLWSHVISYVVIVLVQIVLWALLTPDIFFWPLWSIVAWGIGLGFHVWAVRSRLLPGRT
ncbi:2TM domain-containing protein [Parafrankia irregularis]|uniref:2TM domain-containing protein n=1 Tax=Parafrankia irregularis TaxID=795642 RepID=A0A0S4QS83_9ACTN|nr:MULTISPECIES: 2TM domain-containing protein [Parafrankia]MBE3205906.1 2TM domain-containing protein [Parafrankia sp. CH37]CUU58148.1 2TM domain-containing protein [Parafrankia irregularis]